MSVLDIVLIILVGGLGWVVWAILIYKGIHK